MIVQLLLENGADVGAQMYWGSALHAASCGGHEAIVQMLLDKETDAASVVEFQKFGSLVPIRVPDLESTTTSLSDPEN
jgi:hypothetical protein